MTKASGCPCRSSSITSLSERFNIRTMERRKQKLRGLARRVGSAQFDPFSETIPTATLLNFRFRERGSREDSSQLHYAAGLGDLYQNGTRIPVETAKP